MWIFLYFWQDVVNVNIKRWFTGNSIGYYCGLLWSAWKPYCWWWADHHVITYSRRFQSSSIFKTPLTKQRLWVAHLTAEQVSSIASTVWQGQVCSLLAKRPDDFRNTTERFIASFDYRNSGLLCSQKSLTKVLYGFWMTFNNSYYQTFFHRYDILAYNL